MRLLLAVLALTLCLHGCRTMGARSAALPLSDDTLALGADYPMLLVNGRVFNSAIVNFESGDDCDLLVVTGWPLIPSAFNSAGAGFTPRQRGQARRGRCVRQVEFRVSLTYLEKGAGDTLRLGGMVTAYRPPVQIPLAQVRVVRRGREVSRTLARDGRFDLVASAGGSAVMKFEMIGFRTLEVDLGRLASIAGTASPAPAR